MIGIISDTHDNVENILKALKVFEKSDVEFIIHLGDIVAPATVKFFKGFRVHFVKGNNDGDVPLLRKKCEEIFASFSEETLELEYKGKRMIATHYPEKAEELIKTQKYDYVFYGHDHTQRNEKVGKTRAINPGAHYYKTDNSIVLLDVEKDSVKFIKVS